MGPQSSFYRGLSSLTDVVLINIVTLIGCLPIVTAGAALTAANRVMSEMVRDAESYVIRTWWRSFKTNLRQSLVWWVPAALLLAGAWLQNWMLGGTTNASTAGALTALILVAILIITALLGWILPLTAFFTNSALGHLGNAAALSMRYPGRTVLCLVVTFAPALIFVALPGARTAAAWFMVVLGVAFVNYLNALIQKPVISGLLRASASS